MSRPPAGWLDDAREQLARALNASPAERVALVELATELGTPPTPCPRCGGAMGDGDRVSANLCAVCRPRRGGRR